jgi:predicted extracellular nuclease
MASILINPIKTPLYAAFFCAIILSACASEPQQAQSQCNAPNTPVASVQGDGFESPMLAQTVTVRGVVSLIQGESGLYLEESESDSDPDTSNAIFIETTALTNDLEVGSLIAVKGTVTELGKRRDTLTALTNIAELSVCDSGQTIPLTEVKLPLDSRARESIEGMRIHMDGPLLATDVYGFGQGNITLSGNGVQVIPTEVLMPGTEAADLTRQNRDFALAVSLSESMELPEFLVSGSSIDQITGVMTHDGRGKRLFLQSGADFRSVEAPPPVIASAGSLRIVGMNLHNYFNGDGSGEGFPTPRGAKTLEDFNAQRSRIGAAIKVLDPHVVAVMELENDGFDASSAAQDFIQLANEATGKQWIASRPADDNTGTDKIAVGIFYRTDQLKAIGPANTLTGPEFKRSRQPQAQVFERLSNGEKMLVVINHLKSKGSCPESGEESDQKDGQGCWNPMRRVSAEIMSSWAKDIAASAETENILILGDMNAYRYEDPISAIRQAGFTELMDKTQDQKDQPPVYSFVYFGQHGTLDYAFASKSLLETVQKAYIWNVNAALPARMPLPSPWLRFSDHDPVVVDIR